MTQHLIQDPMSTVVPFPPMRVEQPVDLYQRLSEAELVKREREETNHDLRLIGIGLACGYAFVFVCIARVAALGWL